VLVHVEGAAGLTPPDELRLSVFTESAAPVRDRRIPETGKPVLPGDLVLYPRDSRGAIRIWVRALGPGGPLGDGATTASLLEGKQLEVTVLIAVATLPDRDGDGIPDAVDNCPDLANPQQGPCALLDAGPPDAPDRPADALADRTPEAAADLPQCDVDGDGHLAMSCGGADCDDQNPLIHPKRDEGPPGDATCGDGLDNDCDGSADLLDTECRSCTSDGDCDDQSVCTNDSCGNGVCKSSPANNGAACDDGNACTTGSSCQGGTCTGGTAVTCPTAAACKTASCDPTKGCVTTSKNDGTGCDDGLFCTVNDACKAGSCTGGTARDCQSGVAACNAGSCNEAQDRCEVTPVANGTLCDDQDACTQGESCQAGSCKPPALLDEPVNIGTNIVNGLDRTIRVDSKGKLHAVVTLHNGSVATAIRYITNSSGSWVGVVVASVGGAASGYPSLVLDASDQPHLTFADAMTNKVRYAKRASGGLTFTVSDVASGRGPTSLAIDGNGTLHLGYLDAQLRYAVRAAAGIWQTYQVSTTIKNPQEAELSLALDAAGLPQLAFGDGGDAYGGKLRHASMGGSPSSWTVSEPPGVPSDRAAYHPSLAIAANGVVQIAHFSVDLSPAVATLRLTQRTGSTWSSQIVSSATGTPQYAGIFCALTLDSKGSAQIAYRDSLSDELRFTTNASGSWTSTLLAKNGNVGRWLSLARATSGALHVLFEKEIGYEVRHIAFSACP
jgi:hypothetical protein